MNLYYFWKSLITAKNHIHISMLSPPPPQTFRPLQGNIKFGMGHLNGNYFSMFFSGEQVLIFCAHHVTISRRNIIIDLLYFHNNRW